MRLRRAVSLVNRKTSDTTRAYIGLENIEPWTGKLIAAESDQAGDGIASLFEVGDVLFGKLRPYLAKVAVTQASGRCTSELLVLRSARLLPRFLQYVLLAEPFIRAIDASTFGSKMPRADWEFIGQVIVPVPGEVEQDALTEFLDRKTAAIDALIAKKERLIALLQEKRQALITQAVTKGLDPNVQMKDSGVPWLGLVPRHWEVKPVRRLFRSLDGRRIPVEAAERSQRQGDYPYFGASGVIDSIDAYIFDEPLVLVCEDGWNLLLRSQLVARPLRGRAWVNNHAHVLRAESGDVDYWAAAIEQTPFELFVTGMRQPKLTADALKEIPVPAPPDSETHSIAAYLRDSHTESDGMVRKLRESADRLREYRQALITAAVTGKIDVSTEVTSNAPRRRDARPARAVAAAAQEPTA
jgi:type I restriction enzyme, S subunit